MLDKTLLFLTFATGKQLPFNSPLNNNVGDIFGVLELLQYTTLPNLERNIQIGFVIPIPARTCAIQSRFPLAFLKSLWTKGPLTITRWGSDDFDAVSNEKTLNFQLKSEKSINQISSRGGMTEIFRHKIMIWIVCGKGIEIWCFSLYCVDVCKRLYCDNNLAGYTLSFIALVVAITIYLSLRYFARKSQIW